MLGFKEMRFPVEVSAWAVGGPEWNTRVFELDNGEESRIQVWQYPLHKFDVGAGLREVANATATKTFQFRARGRAFGFRMLDPFDSAAAASEGKLIATGVGSTYQLCKDYVEDGDTFRRPIVKPIPGTVVMTKNGTPIADSVDYATGLAVITGVVGGDVLAWSGRYDVPVRFDEDWLQIGQNAGGLMDWNSIKLVELRRPGTSTGTPPTYTGL